MMWSFRYIEDIFPGHALLTSNNMRDGDNIQDIICDLLIMEIQN